MSEDAGKALITVTLSTQSGKLITVSYATSDGTAEAGVDYRTTSGTLTFTPSLVARAFAISIIDDTLDEADETIMLTLDNPLDATLKTPISTTLIIMDDDYRIYLPLVMKRWPPIPYTPVLNSIANPDGSGSYSISWS